MAAEVKAEAALNTVVASFNTCIGCFNLVVKQDSDQNNKSLYTKLSNQKLRLFLWGESVGLASRELGCQARPNLGLNDTYIQLTVVHTLNAIKDLLSETKEANERHGHEKEDESSGSASWGLGRIRGAINQLKCQPRQNQEQKTRTTFNAERLEAKITQLVQFIDALQSSTASLVLFDFERDRLRQDIESMSRTECLRLLRDFSDPETEDISDMAGPVPTRIASGSRKGSFNRLKWRILGSPVKQPEDTLVPLKSAVKYDRKHSSRVPASRNTTGTLILHKLVIHGDAKAGKAALALQMSPHDYSKPYDPTLEDTDYRHLVAIDGVTCLVEFQETLKEPTHTALLEQWIKDGDGFIIVYSIHSRASFDRVQGFYDHIVKVKGGLGEDRTQVVVVLLGHDYYEDEHGQIQNGDREVSIRDGQNLAKVLRCGFIEASVKDGTNVEKAFHDVVRALRKQRVR